MKITLKVALLAVIAASCSSGSVNAKKSDNKKESLPIVVTTMPGNTVIANYWIELDDPQGWEMVDKEVQEALIKDWNVQEAFRKQASDYTNLIMQDGTSRKVKFRTEQITNPDGDAIAPGILHSLPEIPSCGAMYDVEGRPLSEEVNYGVIVTDEYLKRHKQLTLADNQSSCESETPLPTEIVKALEQRYGMKAALSKQLCRIDGRYIYGSVQFKGEWPDAPKHKDNPDSKYCLAVDVLADGQKLYVNEKPGYYISDTDFGWNVDDEGVYVGCPLIAAFQGDEGPVLCYYRPAVESVAVGIYSAADGRLNLEFSTTYQSMFDECIPVWKSDIAEMERLYCANDPENGPNTKFTKWSYVFVGDGIEAIWAVTDEDDLNGAIFQRKDGKLSLIAETARNRKPAFGRIADRGYLSVSGSGGGPSWYREIYVFQDGKLIETFTCLEVYDKIDGCTLNGEEISPEEGNAYMRRLPEFKAYDPYFHTLE